MPCSVADHELVTATVNVRKEKRTPITKTFRSLETYSQNTFCQLLLDQTHLLKDILSTDNVTDQVQIFNCVFIYCLDACAPFVTKIIKRPPAPWINTQIKEAMKVRDRLQIEFKSDRNNHIKEIEYRAEKKRVSEALSESKDNYFKGEFIKNKGNIKGTWNTIRKIVPCNKNISNNFPCSENDIQKRVEDFNDYFAKVGEDTFKKSQENEVDANEFSVNINGAPNILENFRP